MTRGYDDLNGRPPIPDRRSEVQSIHRAWHVYIRDHDPDVRVHIYERDGIVSGRCVVNSEALVLQKRRDIHPNRDFVLHDKNSDSILPHAPPPISHRHVFF